MTKQFAQHTLITIVRPNGVTEVVKRGGGLTDAEFAKAKAATAAAGRGELVSFEVVMRDVPDYSAERAFEASTNAILGAMQHRAESRVR